MGRVTRLAMALIVCCRLALAESGQAQLDQGFGPVVLVLELSGGLQGGLIAVQMLGLDTCDLVVHGCGGAAFRVGA